jgi:cobalamin biosynthesis protein CobD/CbiB
MRKEYNELKAPVVNTGILTWMVVIGTPILLAWSVWHFLPTWPRFVPVLLGIVMFGFCFILVEWVHRIINRMFGYYS